MMRRRANSAVWVAAGMVLSVLACRAALPAEGPEPGVGPRRKRVIEVRFVGLYTIDPEALKRRIATRPKAAYRPGVVSRDILRLEAMGAFDAISVVTEDVPGGVRVIFQVSERPFVRSIKLEGGLRAGQGRLLDLITRTVLDKRFDAAKASADCQDILDWLRKRSYYDASVTFGAVPIEGPGLGRPGGVRVIFTVDEGAAVYVKEISFEGNRVLTGRELLKQVKTREKHWYNSGAVEDWELEWDAARLRAAYRTRGYMDVVVSVLRGARFSDARGNTWVRLTFKIDEGVQYKVGRVSIQGNEIVSSERIASVMKLKPGEFFSDGRRSADSQAVSSIYGEMGRVFTSARIRRRLAEEPGVMDVTVDISEGQVVRVRQIEPLGNTKTKDIVILREMLLDPGDTFDSKKLGASMRNIRRLGFFDPAVLRHRILPTDDPAEADILIEVKEQMTGMFSMGFGYSSNDEFVGQFQLEQRNFDLFDWPKSWADFTSGNALVGDGQKLGLNASWGSTRTSYSLSWQEPWLFNRRLRLGIKAYDTSRAYSDYDEERTGAKLSLGKSWKNDFAVSIFGEVKNVDIDHIDSGVDPFSPIRDEEGFIRVNSMGVALGYDGRDSYMFPTEGIRIRLSEEVAGGPFSGDRDFLKSNALISGHIPLGWRKRRTRKAPPVLNLRIKGDWVVPYGDSDTAPIYERYFAGGYGTLRGYDFRSISPRFPDEDGDEVGGQFRLLETAELTFPLTAGEGGQIRGAIFLDSGFVWADPSDYDWEDQRQSWGLGLIIMAGGMPIRIYWGFPIDRVSSDDVERVSFMFGPGF